MPDTNQNTKRRKGSKHDKTGCLTCRYRRKKCTPNTFPVCGACKRLNLECVREPTRQVLATPRESSVQSQPHGIWRDWLPSIPGSHDQVSRRRQAINFYITVLSRLLSVSDQHNSFVSAFIPMAVDSAPLAHAIVAWSSGHLSTLDRSYSITALEARSASLRALSAVISSHDASCHETNAATSLILLTSEVCLGDYTKWYNHLNGVKNMIMSCQSKTRGSILHGPEILKQSPEGQWILRNFAYHDIIGSITLGKPPLLDPKYLKGITDVVDTYVGVAMPILTIISEISSMKSLNLVRDYTSQRAIQDLEGSRSFWEVEEGLKKWTCCTVSSPELQELAYAYRDAALIFLYRRTYRALVMEPTVGTTRERHYTILNSAILGKVISVLGHIINIPMNAGAESALLFPIFLAGAEATEGEHINVVRSRLRLLADKRPFHNILRAWEVLEDVWDARQSNANVDWQAIIDRRGGGLLLT
ncbi:fungal-specific transcription factor domain-containing protein [Aspergillus ambiguus]|uniref:Zn(II)2Cys6 transcription factor n=1 Tax=Aspergillus ambiguus TaxID=176160 RepID=UPI003CCDB68A